MFYHSFICADFDFLNVVVGGGARNIYLGSYSPKGLEDGSLLVGLRGENQIEGLGDCPAEAAQAVYRYCLQILTAETIKIEYFAQFLSSFLTNMFHLGS